MVKKILVAGLFVSTLFASNSIVLDMKQKLTIQYDKETIGFVRHQKIYKYPSWVAEIKLRSGKKLFFSSPKSMLELYFQPGRWYDLNIKKESDFKQILVTDFKTLEPIDARGAFYVYGSSNTSPAGDDLPAFSTYQRAQEFMQKNNGRRILSFDKLSQALINLLNGRI